MRRLLLLLATSVILNSDITASSFLTTDGPSSGSINQITMMSIRSPNISLVNDNVYLCMSFDVPVFPDEETYLVKITPAPIFGKYEHIVSHVCDEPGYRPVDGIGRQASIWDCSQDFFGGSTPALESGHACVLNGSFSIGTFGYQYQKGSIEDATLVLPPGTGVPVGGKSVVLYLHFPELNRTIDHMTGVSGLDFGLVRSLVPLKLFNSLMMAVEGFVGPESVDWVSGSWTLKQDISITVSRIYTHSHGLSIDFKVWVIRPDGQEDLLVHQDPQKYWGIVNITDSPSSRMQKGDNLAIKCMFNNTMSSVLRIEDKEMCAIVAFYFVEGQEVLSTQSVVSYDTLTAHCFQYRDSTLGFESNIDASGSYRQAIADKDCYV